MPAFRIDGRTFKQKFEPRSLSLVLLCLSEQHPRLQNRRGQKTERPADKDLPRHIFRNLSKNAFFFASHRSTVRSYPARGAAIRPPGPIRDPCSFSKAGAKVHRVFHLTKFFQDFFSKKVPHQHFRSQKSTATYGFPSASCRLSDHRRYRQRHRPTLLTPDRIKKFFIELWMSLP